MKDTKTVAIFGIAIVLLAFAIIAAFAKTKTEVKIGGNSNTTPGIGSQILSALVSIWTINKDKDKD